MVVVSCWSGFWCCSCVCVGCGGRIWELVLLMVGSWSVGFRVWSVLFASPKMVLVGCRDSVLGPILSVVGVMSDWSVSWNGLPPVCGFPFMLAIVV